jgi:hypothetical protein
MGHSPLYIPPSREAGDLHARTKGRALSWMITPVTDQRDPLPSPRQVREVIRGPVETCRVRTTWVLTNKTFFDFRNQFSSLLQAPYVTLSVQ